MSILNISHSIHNRIRGPLIKRIHSLLFSPTSLVNVTNDEELIKELSSSLPDEFLVSRTSKLIRGSSILSFEMLGITHRVIYLAGTIKLYVKTLTEERIIVKHLVSGYPDGPSRERLLNMQIGDIVMIQGNMHLQKEVVKKKSPYYHGALKLFSAIKVGTDYRDFIQNTYSLGTVLGRVIGEFVATSDPFYEGYISVMTWRDRVEKHFHVQTCRIMISKKAMRRFSFIKELMVGEKIMVDGLIDYMTIPNVDGSLLVVSANEIIRVDRIGKCNGEVLSNVST